MTELVRQAEEFKAYNAVRAAALSVGRARRYGWPADRQAVLEEVLAAARGRLVAVKNRDPGGNV
jgi:hypothetical protein